MIVYELCAREGFETCCSTRIPKIWLQQDNIILKEYESWYLDIPNDLYDIDKYFNRDDSKIKYGRLDRDDVYKCKIFIPLYINLNILVEFLNKFVGYTQKIKEIYENFISECDKNEIFKRVDDLDSRINSSDIETYDAELEMDWHMCMTWENNVRYVYDRIELTQIKLRNIKIKLYIWSLKSVATREEFTNIYLQILKEFEEK